MELYKGLPLKTITAQDKDGEEYIFGVTTELVDTLITKFLLDDSNEPYMLVATVEEFDQNYSYAVPQEVFEKEDEDILAYINTEIDNMGFTL